MKKLVATLSVLALFTSLSSASFAAPIIVKKEVKKPAIVKSVKTGGAAPIVVEQKAVKKHHKKQLKAVKKPVIVKSVKTGGAAPIVVKKEAKKTCKCSHKMDRKAVK